MSRGVVTISPGNLPDGYEPAELVRHLEGFGYAVVFALDPGGVMVYERPDAPTQRERIATALLAACITRDSPDAFHISRVDQVLSLTDTVIEALNKEPTAP